MKYFILTLKIVFLFSLAVYGATYYYNGYLVGLPRGISNLSKDDPAQKVISDKYSISFEKGDFTYKAEPIHDYKISGVVVKRTNYGFLNNEVDAAAPIDLCMVWGDNLKGSLYLKDDANYTQFERFCYYNFSKTNAFRADQFANNRLVINDAKILDRAEDINVGDEVVVKGRLINLLGYKKTDSKNPVLDWKSSVSRIDSGDGACEVIYVDSIDIVGYAHYKESVMNHFTFYSTIVAAGLLVLYVIGLAIFMVPQKKRDDL